MFTTVKRFVRSQSREDVLYECRHCGRSHDGPSDTCDCGESAGVARYRIR